MANRTVFMPHNQPPFYRAMEVEFEWVKGLPSLQNAIENALALQKRAEECLGDQSRVIEVSRAGTIARDLSAFRLQLSVLPNHRLPLEVVYQSAKVWDTDSECKDLLTVDLQGVSGSRRAKKAANSKRVEKTTLKSFCLRIGEVQQAFATKPFDAFYNWLYITTLRQPHNHELVESVLNSIEHLETARIGFCDVFFKSEDKLGARYNCQARAVALFVGLMRSSPEALERLFPAWESLKEALASGAAKSRFSEFLSCVYQIYPKSAQPLASPSSTGGSGKSLGLGREPASQQQPKLIDDSAL